MMEKLPPMPFRTPARQSRRYESITKCKDGHSGHYELYGRQNKLS